jgi:hypothetical protein
MVRAGPYAAHWRSLATTPDVSFDLLLDLWVRLFVEASKAESDMNGVVAAWYRAKDVSTFEPKGYFAIK